MRNETVKQNALKALIREAHFERVDSYPLPLNPYPHNLQPFNNTKIQTNHLKSLLRVLKRSDALETLYNMVTDGEF